MHIKCKHIEHISITHLLKRTQLTVTCEVLSEILKRKYVWRNTKQAVSYIIQSQFPYFFDLYFCVSIIIISPMSRDTVTSNITSNNHIVIMFVIYVS
jgi:hypothetical protein